MTLSPQSSSESRWPFRWSVLLACATFPLIWVGGLVTTYDAGMAVPDWPTTFGYNLFRYPLTTWIAGPWDLFIEHGHRLLGAAVGLIAIGFVGSVWRHERRSWVRTLAVIVLLAVIAQGVLGGLRVRYNNRQLAMLHGCFGPAFFAFVAAMTVFLSASWRPIRPATRRSGSRLVRLATMLSALAYIQLVLGATLRHLPSFVTPNGFRFVVVFHLLTAVAILGHIVALRVRIERDFSRISAVRFPVRVLVHLAAIQVALGIGTWIVKYGWPSWFSQWQFAATYVVEAKGMWQSMIVTAHVATGSIILAISVVLTVQAARRFLVVGAENPIRYGAGGPPGGKSSAHSRLAMEVSP